MDCEKSCERCEHCLYVGEGDFWCDDRLKREMGEA